MGTSRHMHWHGSSVYQGESSLDQERAASMADEGGVSGAITDAHEQAKPTHLARPARLGGVKLWAPLGLLGLGVALFALFRLRR